MTYSDTASLYGKHLSAGFIELLETLGYARLLVKAEGAWTWDDHDRKYLDLVAGFGSMNLGHHEPRLHEALVTALAAKPYNFLHTGPSEAAAELARDLVGRTRPPLDRVLFSCSGAEAVEGAIKIVARATGRNKLIYTEDAFHGTSFGTLGLMGKDRMRGPFERLLSKHTRIPYDSIEALERTLKRDKCAAFIVEPVLAEGGVCLPATDYLDRARELCHRHGALLVVDEIQTGLGRTGRYLASDRMTSPPDVVILGKALSGGLMPISATLTSTEIYERAFRKAADFDLHNSTFAGNALACRVAQRTLSILDDDQLTKRSAVLGERLLAALREKLAGHPFVREIRGQGLLVGIEIGPTKQGILNRLAPGLVEAAAEAAVGQWFAVKLLERGVLIQTASHRWDVLKVQPPLTITDAELTFAIDAIAATFDGNRKLPAIAWDLVKRVTSK